MLATRSVITRHLSTPLSAQARRGRVAAALLAVFAPAAFAQSPTATASADASAVEEVDSSVVPTYVDVAERGLRSRIDVGGRMVAVGNPNPPIRLEVDDKVQDRNDLDVGTTVILGFDRPFGMPMTGDLMGTGFWDIGGDSPVSPFLDERSAAPRARLYSAFVGFSGAPGELLEPMKINVGRMTEMGESPITYDGVSGGVALRFKQLGYVNAKLWGGLDGPQHLADDPFTRRSARAYSEAYVDDSGFISPTGGVSIQRTAIADPILNPVGGIRTDGRLMGIGWLVTHTLLPTLQRTQIGAGYQLDIEYLVLDVFADVKASDFLPRVANLRGDVMTWDGTTRIGLNAGYQFLEDICNFDCTFRAFNPANTFVKKDADAIEAIRVRDQIRHLNIGPEQEHVRANIEGERQLPLGFSVLLRGRVKHYLDANDLDYFRTNIYEAGAGGTWSPGFSMNVGLELAGGFLNNGKQNGALFDNVAEGLSSYAEVRTSVRNVLLDGKLSHLGEVFVRRQDIQSKAIAANGQWSGAVASSLRYDILDAWSASIRLDADMLSPVDSLNTTGYLGGTVATSVRF